VSCYRDPGSAHVWNIEVANPSEVNSAIEYYCEVGDIQDDVLRPQLSLLASLISEPAFNVLRTKEQLGYIVFALPRASTGTMGMRFLIQSEKDTVYLETRVEAFFDYMKEFLDNLSEEEYEKHKAGVIHKKLEKPKNLHGESSRFWTAVEDGYYDFERRKSGSLIFAIYGQIPNYDLVSLQNRFQRRRVHQKHSQAGHHRPLHVPRPLQLADQEKA
jgi:secreted Zn-dependent insulinase-like peptidase